MARQHRHPGSHQIGRQPCPKNKTDVLNLTGAIARHENDIVLVKLSPEASQEITAGGFAPVEMMVHRKAAEGDQIVTRLRIANPPNKENLVIADNLYGWEQVPVEAGDIVVY